MVVFLRATTGFSKYYINDMQQPYTNSTHTHRAVIALGANIASRFGPPVTSILVAIDRISTSLGPITGKSRLFLTPCFPSNAGPDYINAAIMVETVLTPSKALQELHKIEAESGRLREERWGKRGLDLDLISLEATVLPDKSTYMTWRKLAAELQKSETPDQLILPHPRLQERAFVLVPMVEVAPDWVHPVLGKTTREMLDSLPAEAVAEVVPIETPEKL